jgi:hypothetical protein
VTSAKLLQRRLTAVDLGLDAGLQRRYEVLKQVLKVFTDSFDLAAREPRLPYDPDRADPGEADRRISSFPRRFFEDNLHRLVGSGQCDLVKPANGFTLRHGPIARSRQPTLDLRRCPAR